MTCAAAAHVSASFTRTSYRPGSERPVLHRAALSRGGSALTRHPNRRTWRATLAPAAQGKRLPKEPFSWRVRRLAPAAPVTAIVPAITRAPTVPACAHHNRCRAVSGRTVIHRRRCVIRRRRWRVVDRRRRRRWVVHRCRGHIHRGHRHAKPDADAHVRRRHLRHGQHCQCGCTCNPQHIASNHLHHLQLKRRANP